MKIRSKENKGKRKTWKIETMAEEDKEAGKRRGRRRRRTDATGENRRGEQRSRRNCGCEATALLWRGTKGIIIKNRRKRYREWKI